MNILNAIKIQTERIVATVRARYAVLKPQHIQIKNWGWFSFCPSEVVFLFLWVRTMTSIHWKLTEYLEQPLSSIDNKSSTVKGFWRPSVAKRIWKDLHSVWPRLTGVQIPWLKGQPSFLLTRHQLKPEILLNLKATPSTNSLSVVQLRGNGPLRTSIVSFHVTIVHVLETWDSWLAWNLSLNFSYLSPQYSWQYENKQMETEFYLL